MNNNQLSQQRAIQGGKKTRYERKTEARPVVHKGRLSVVILCDTVDQSERDRETILEESELKQPARTSMVKKLQRGKC